jgi:menaquinone-dependent protoporphyrinogen oxidase
VKVLVAAASRHGSTEGIAEAIGAVLAEHGLDVDVRRLDRVDDPEAFEAVVLGSAVYVGRWLPEARRFVEEHAGTLAARPTWLFSSGPVGEPPKPEGEAAVDAGGLVELTGAREHRIFPGKLEKAELGLRERAVVRAVGAAEGDFRDWEAVAAWAAAIARELGH